MREGEVRMGDKEGGKQEQSVKQGWKGAVNVRERKGTEEVQGRDVWRRKGQNRNYGSGKAGGECEVELEKCVEGDGKQGNRGRKERGKENKETVRE